MTDDDAARRSRLLGIKLCALVRDHLDDDVGSAAEFAPGAALDHRGEAWVYLDDRPATRLGAALAWAVRADCAALHVIAERDTGVLARRAAEFGFPVDVWHADDRVLLPAVPEPLTPSAPPPAGHERFRERIATAGATPLVEHGVLFGEVRGLEVCRVVDDADTGTTRLEVGVGAHDREAFQMLHGDVPAVESLERIVETVAEHRALGAPRHPLNRLAAERFLRWRLEQGPSVVGATSLAPTAPPVPRPNLKDAVPCVATGVDTDGGGVVVVCASGVDLDLIPFAADARLAATAATSPGTGGGLPRLVVATPPRDHVRVTDQVAGLLKHPVDFVDVA